MQTAPKDETSNARWILLSALTLGVPFLLLFTYNYSSVEINFWGIPLKKITAVDSLDLWTAMASNQRQQKTHNDTFPWLPKFDIHNEQVASKIAIIPFAPGILPDSLLSKSETADSIQIQSTDSTLSRIIYLSDTISFTSIPKSDTSEQRVLFMGDSQAGGLLHIFNDYCVENGHKMVAAHVWNSATIYNYGFSKRVDELIIQYQPTLIVLVLGLNELHAHDIAKRTRAANLLREKFGNIPYLWVGPANYMEDSGINKVFEQVATSERFILSKHLNLPKGSDKRHPNHDGYKIWMDYIARFIQASKLYDFKFEKPKRFGNRISGKVIYTNASNDRGY